MSKKTYDVGIIGTGPAGFMAALRLVKLRPNLKIVMFEKGKLRSAQEAKVTREKYDAGDKSVNVTEGWGGAGAFSDGKYNLDETGRVGGQLVTGGYISQEEYIRLLHEACQLYIEFGGDPDRLMGYDNDDMQKKVLNAQSPQEAMVFQQMIQQVEDMHQIALGKRMLLHTFPIQHLGTSQAHRIVENIRKHLVDAGVNIKTETRVTNIEFQDGLWYVDSNRSETQCKKLLVCPGRSGAKWFRDLCIAKEYPLENNGVDIGVRVETTNTVMQQLSRLFYESKVYFKAPNDDQLRTFCMCPSGRVAIEEYLDTKIFCANGHTDPEHPSPNCNFAILQTQQFTKPFNNPLGYADWIAKMTTELSGGVIIQRLGDLRRYKRSTPERIKDSFVIPTLTEEEGALPGNFALSMPGQFVYGITKFLEALDALAPGINNDDTLLYFPEIKFNAVKVVANSQNGFEVVPGLHVAGDGSGYTRGLNGASIHGLFVAEKLAQMFEG